jgi:hypothetical protein
MRLIKTHLSGHMTILITPRASVNRGSIAIHQGYHTHSS